MIGAKFILKIWEEYRISQRTLNNVVSDVKGLWMSSISDSIKHYCQKYESPIDPLMDCIKDNFPLFGLETEYLQQKFYKEHFNYLVSTYTLQSVNIIVFLLSRSPRREFLVGMNEKLMGYTKRLLMYLMMLV